MPAGPTLPSGWTLTNYQGGTAVAASVTIPAVPGVTHVLDAFSLKLSVNAAFGAPGQLVLSANGLDIGLVYAAAAPSADEASGQDLGIAAPSGSALTITVDGAAGVNGNVLLVVQGHST